MPKAIQIYATAIALLLFSGACDSNTNQTEFDERQNSEIDKMFDFSNLNAPTPRDTGPKICLYDVRTTKALLNRTKHRDGGLHGVFNPCTWNEGSLTGVILGAEGSCPKSTDKRFDGLLTSEPVTVSMWDMPIGCYSASERSDHDFDIEQQIEANKVEVICIKLAKDGGPNSVRFPDEFGGSNAAANIGIWQRDYGLPVRYTISSGDELQVVLNSQYRAWGSEWSDVLFAWLQDFGFEPTPSRCPSIKKP